MFSDVNRAACPGNYELAVLACQNIPAETRAFLRSDWLYVSRRSRKKIDAFPDIAQFFQRSNNGPMSVQINGQTIKLPM